MAPRHVVALAVLAAVAIPGFAAAEPTSPTTVPPPTSVGPQNMPPTTAAEAPEAAITVGNEAQYRSAVTTLSADASGPHTIDLTADITVDDGNDPTYTGTQNLTIDGHGFLLDAVGTSRLLVVDSPTDAALTLRDVEVRNGSATGDGGAVLVLGASVVQVVDSVFAFNQATGSGGAIQVPLAATVDGSSFVHNVALAGDGGALDAAAAEGQFEVRQSQFWENRAPDGAGGAISAVGFGFPSADQAISRSSFIGNTADEGGALVLGGGAVVDNSTIHANQAFTRGGGILAEGSSLSAGIYLTVTANAAPEGANLDVTGREVQVVFSVLAEPRFAENCAVGGGANFTLVHADDASCGARFDLGSPELGPLVDQGPPPFRLPLAGSPLIDAIEAGYGFPNLEGGCARFQSLEPFDQRGVERPQDGDGESRSYLYGGTTYEEPADCDIGAVEADAYVAPPTGPVPGGPSFTG